MIDAGELKKGMAIEVEGELFRVLECHHIKMGRGSAQLRLKLRSLDAGHTTERSFQSSEKFKDIDIDYREVQFLYQDSGLYYFMDTRSFEQFTLDAAQLGDVVKFLGEGSLVRLQTYGDRALGVDLAAAVALKVKETGPGFKGDTSGGGKPAVLETGLTVQVPFFINSGDIIKVDTRTAEYLERAG